MSSLSSSQPCAKNPGSTTPSTTTGGAVSSTASPSNPTNGGGSSNGKTARGSSLDRRFGQRHNRQERDSKSRSAHSLQEHALFSDGKESAKGIFQSVSHIGYRTLSHIHPQTHTDKHFSTFHSTIRIHSEIAKYHKDAHPKHSKYYNNSYHRNPSYWDAMPSYMGHCESEPHYNYHPTASREELQMLEYHRKCHDLYRYDSNGMLNGSQGNCCHFIAPPPPVQMPPIMPPLMPPYCSPYEQRSMPGPSTAHNLWNKKVSKVGIAPV